MRTVMKLAPITLLLLVAPAACGGGERTSTGSTTTTATATSGASTTGGSTVAVVKVSANTATVDQLEAALTAAGVANAARWAREVEEYRPYDKGDANLTKLRQNLQKYNPGTETMNKIISALEP